MCHFLYLGGPTFSGCPFVDDGNRGTGHFDGMVLPESIQSSNPFVNRTPMRGSVFQSVPNHLLNNRQTWHLLNLSKKPAWTVLHSISTKFFVVVNKVLGHICCAQAQGALEEPRPSAGDLWSNQTWWIWDETHGNPRYWRQSDDQ